MHQRPVTGVGWMNPPPFVPGATQADLSLDDATSQGSPARPMSAAKKGLPAQAALPTTTWPDGPTTQGSRVLPKTK